MLKNVRKLFEQPSRISDQDINRLKLIFKECGFSENFCLDQMHDDYYEAPHHQL